MLSTLESRLSQLIDAGFDRSKIYEADDESDASISVRCSQCEALVINGVACHEARCPNTPADEPEEDFFDELNAWEDEQDGE